jgi:hypothetical protein
MFHMKIFSCSLKCFELSCMTGTVLEDAIQNEEVSISMHGTMSRELQHSSCGHVLYHTGKTTSSLCRNGVAPNPIG